MYPQEGRLPKELDLVREMVPSATVLKVKLLGIRQVDPSRVISLTDRMNDFLADIVCTPINRVCPTE